MLENNVLYSGVIKLNPRTKKNSQRILKNWKTGKRFISQSEIYEHYQNDCGWFLNGYQYKPISQPIQVKALFYRKDNIRVDLSNLIEALADILVKYRILEDDSFKIIKSWDGSRVFVDKENPRTEFEIIRFLESE